MILNVDINRLLWQVLYVVILPGIICVAQQTKPADIIEPVHAGSGVNQKEEILARVGDKYITVNEFYERAEYSVRPEYVKNNSNIEKKIILNSLIAEKLIAIERGNKSRAKFNEKINNNITGIKEQVMRQLLYREEGVNKVKLDSTEFKKQYKLAGRTYELNFINIEMEAEANYVKRQIERDSVTLENIYFQLTGESKLPEYQMNWNSIEHPGVHDILYSGVEVKPGKVYGPVKYQDSFLFFKVKEWTDRPAVTTTDKVQRFKNVKDRLTGDAAAVQFDKYIRKVMKGKRIDFDKDTFIKLANIYGPVLMGSNEERREEFLNVTLKNIVETDPVILALKGDVNAIADEPLFSIDGEIWSVAMFEKQKDTHPLVFRTSRLSNKNFAEQFKLAMVDMIRDKYLTEQAYKRKLDDSFMVQRITNMWSDATVSYFEQIEILHAAEFKGDNPILAIQKIFNPYIDKLQKKYSDVIEINTEAFKSIKLSSTDLFAWYPALPYKVAVPAFPMITTDRTLDYGKKMKSNNIPE